MKIEEVDGRIWALYNARDKCKGGKVAVGKSLKELRANLTVRYKLHGVCLPATKYMCSKDGHYELHKYVAKDITPKQYGIYKIYNRDSSILVKDGTLGVFANTIDCLKRFAYSDFKLMPVTVDNGRFMSISHSFKYFGIKND